MRIAIVGGGMAGLTLARALRDRDVEPLVLERAPASARIPGPIMLPYQAYDALEDVGALAEIRASGWDVAPGPDGVPVAIGVGRQVVVDALRAGVPVEHEAEVVDLLRENGRVTGLRVTGPGGEREVQTDLVVGADGVRSRVRELAGIPAELRRGEFAGLSFRSPVVPDVPFAMAYQSDGRQVTMLGWPGGSAGTFQIDPMPPEDAKAPGLEAYKRAFAGLLPAAAPALEGVRRDEDWFYREATEVRCERWWTPGAVLIGEAAHAINPETGIGSGLGMGDAQALAVAIAAERDPDRACERYEAWRRPAVAPYEQLGTTGVRIVTAAPGSERPHAERWPPVD